MASVVAGYSMQTGVGVNGVVSSECAVQGNYAALGGQGVYTDRPTITCVPMTGEKFLRGLITPIDPKNISSLTSASEGVHIRGGKDKPASACGAVHDRGCWSWIEDSALLTKRALTSVVSLFHAGPNRRQRKGAMKPRRLPRSAANGLAAKTQAMIRTAAVSSLLLLAGCVGMPEDVVPVDNFSAPRYLGTWYEIARLDHSFERGLSRVTANYSARADGGVDVLNRGYDETKGAWSESKGKAYFVRGSDHGYLKVSFFGPFYGSYIVFELDRENYRYAVVSGPDKSYLWILARTPEIDAALKASLVAKAAARGFDTGKLIFVDQRIAQ